MIEFERVWKRYSKRRDEWAVEEISFHIGPGEMVFLLGPSGVGKSTLLKLITLEELEREHIEAILTHVRWHKGKACEILGISRPALDRKIEKHGLA